MFVEILEIPMDSSQYRYLLELQTATNFPDNRKWERLISEKYERSTQCRLMTCETPIIARTTYSANYHATDVLWCLPFQLQKSQFLESLLFCIATSWHIPPSMVLGYAMAARYSFVMFLANFHRPNITNSNVKWIICKIRYNESSMLAISSSTLGILCYLYDIWYN